MKFRPMSCLQRPRAALKLAITCSLFTTAATRSALVQAAASPGASSTSAPLVTCVNVTPGALPALSVGAQSVGLALAIGQPDNQGASRVVLWEAREGGGDITPQRALALGEYVRRGGSLLLSLDAHPGAGPMRLAFMLPTTAWRTQLSAASRGQIDGEVAANTWDDAMFPRAEAKSLRVPFHFDLRPFSAVERGQSRYETFNRSIPYINQQVVAGDDFWTRPLLNRDWQIRVRGDDVSGSPLLLTGRYGAGRVAVFTSSATVLNDVPDASAFWAATLRWLGTRDVTSANAAQPGAAQASAITSVATLDAPRRVLHVVLHNPLAAPLEVRVLARLLTWERAPIGDVERTSLLPVNGDASIDIPLPAPSSDGYQALDFRDAFVVRLGVLSSDGATLYSETRLPIDLRPATLLTLATDNLRASAYPFHAPGPDSLAFPSRMGMSVASYAYAPGQPVQAHVMISNGVRNIAPLAKVLDETTPKNATASALNDEAAQGEKGPSDGITAYGMWSGWVGKDNVLTLSFPLPVTIAGVTLVASPDNYRNYLVHNPGAAVIEVDGKEVARADDLDKRFVTEQGRVRFSFTPISATMVRVRLPWLNKLSDGRNRSAPWLGELEVEGAVGPLPAAVQGSLSLTLRDAMSGDVVPVTIRQLSLAPGATQALTIPINVPPHDDKSSRFLRLEAGFDGQSANTPLLIVAPEHPLPPLSDARPANAPELGFIVTRGFRNIFDIGTGTQQISDSWSQPDDLIWAYAHQMKQISERSRQQANRLYVSDSDMRHYSTPWRSFPNGELLYDVAAPLLVERMKKDQRWKDSDTVILAHSDRWDTGPQTSALHGWQDFVDFDEHLRAGGLPGLQSKTHEDLAREIHAHYESQWQAWQLERYVHSVRTLREAFAKEGKKLVITAQGLPLAPANAAQELAQNIKSMSDDSTWGMEQESIPLTTGRQMGELALNPSWQMSTLLQWGWNSGILGNPQWHAPVGTTEPSRRHYYDRAWRGRLDLDGAYRGLHSVGYNTNGGVAYTMTQNDWQEWWRVEERHSLIQPDGPIGAGLVISSSRLNDPRTVAFTGIGELNNPLLSDVRVLANGMRRLHEAGVSLPFVANAASLGKWNGSAPLILLNLNHFSEAEVAALKTLTARGVKLAAFAGDGPISASVAALFGVQPSGSPTTGHKVGELNGKPIVATPNTLLIVAPADDLTAAQAQMLAPLLRQNLELALQFPSGTAGYGFTSQGQNFIEIEDWLEAGRTVEVRWRATQAATAARAVAVNDHRTLAVHRDGVDWVIELPLRPGDGELICIEETR